METTNKTNKVALITGASRGIGFALANRMLADNYFVIGTSRGENIEIENQNFSSLKLDVANNESIKSAHQSIKSKFDKIDVLVNNAGIGPDLNTLIPEQETFNQTFAVNVSGTVFFTEPLIDLLNNGMIVNISSKMGSVDACRNAGSVAYRMSKSALNMYSKILTNRLQDKVKIANIHPGWVKTTIFKGNIENAPLTTQQSAESIYDFISSDFNTGTYWDCEANTALNW